MKNIWIFLAFLGLTACDDDSVENNAGNAPLAMTINTSDLAAGETLTATVRVNNPDEKVERKDMTLYFESCITPEGTPCTLFEEFPASVVLPKSQNEISVDFPVKKSGIEGSQRVRLWVSAEATEIDGAVQDITVSDAHTITISVKDVQDNTVVEGQQFVLLAQSPVPVSEDVTVTVSAENDTYKNDFEDFPANLTIPRGESSAEATVTASEDDVDFDDDHTWQFTATTSSPIFKVADFQIIRSDKYGQKGPKLTDEHWVYSRPDAAFYSANTEGNYLTCPSYRENDVKMTRSNIAGEGSPHPNKDLAAEGWTLLNAVEFHAIDGWSFSRSAKNSYGVHPVAVANGWAAQNTVSVEKNCFIDNNKYTNVLDEGYLRMWAAKDNGNSSNAPVEPRYFGSAALYANKGSGTAIPQNTIIAEGTRVEIRARLRGKRQGFNFAIWLQGNDQSLTWPEYGEIDIMENPVSSADVAGSSRTVHQTLHWGQLANEQHANPTVEQIIDTEEWNIYWVEIVDATTVKMGINGETTKIFTAADNNTSNSYKWPFCNAANPKGFHILLTPGVASDWDGSMNGMPQNDINEGKWADPAVQSMTYEQSVTSDDAPRMEIDWVRYWKNSNYTDMGVAVNPQYKLF